MNTSVKFNLWELKKKLELHKGRDLTIIEMAEGMGVSYFSLLKAINNESGGVQFDTLSKMLEYFRGCGLEISIDDLLTVTKTEGEQNPALVGKNAADRRVALQNP